MGTRFLAGRDFDARDDAKAPLVAIVTETFVKKFLAGASPLGRRIARTQLGGKPDLVYEIVGLVRDAKYRSLREEFTPLVYLAEAQDPEPDDGLLVAVRSELPPAELTGAIARAAAVTTPLARLSFQTFDSVIREALLRERLMATLSGLLGSLAAVLAVIGLYGVISFMVLKRRAEIGVRIALGARRGDILKLVLSEAGRLVAAGLVVGTVLAIAGASAARALLYGLSPGDPATVLAAAAGLAGIAVLATVLPARRAASLDPTRTLREE
jgi:hypothetical protein